MGTTATLTARFVATVTPTETRREYFDRVVTGLALRVAPTGTKSWVVLYRQGRRLRRWTLGRYPTLGMASRKGTFWPREKGPPFLSCGGRRDVAGRSGATGGHVATSAIAVAPPVSRGTRGCVWRP